MRFEPTISAGERPQTYTLDSAPTGTGTLLIYQNTIFLIVLAIRTSTLIYILENQLFALKYTLKHSLLK